MRVKQAAVRLEISPALVYSLIAAGKLPCYRVGNGRGTIRIDESHLAEYLRGVERRQETPPAPTLTTKVKLKHLRL